MLRAGASLPVMKLLVPSMGSMTQRYRGAWTSSDSAPSSMPPSSPKMACVGKLSRMRALMAASACLSASVTGLASALASIFIGALHHKSLLLSQLKCDSLRMLCRYRVMPQMLISAAADCVPEELSGDTCCCVSQLKCHVNELIVYATASYRVRLGTESHGLPCMRWALTAYIVTRGVSCNLKWLSAPYRCPQGRHIGPAEANETCHEVTCSVRAMMIRKGLARTRARGLYLIWE